MMKGHKQGRGEVKTGGKLDLVSTRRNSRSPKENQNSSE